MWQGIAGHDRVVERFAASLAAGRLASTFLFVGPAGIGKRSLALRLAQGLLCSERADGDLAPCGHCPSCTMFAGGSHPDLLLLGRPAGKSFIPIESFIGPQERRMREGLCHDIAMKPFMGGRRVAIIDDADFLNIEGANSLLKTLEEPPPRSVLILIGTSAARQLPTIRSRCQIVRFAPLAPEIMAPLLVAGGFAANEDQARHLAAVSEGSFERAAELAEPAVIEMRKAVLSQITAPVLDSIRMTRELATIVEDAGKEASDRRARLRQMFSLAADYYRELMRAISGVTLAVDPELAAAAGRGAASWPGDEELAARCLDRSLLALEQLERNANTTTLLECWLNDLERAVACCSDQPVVHCGSPCSVSTSRRRPP